MADVSFGLGIQLDLGARDRDEETDRLTRALRAELGLVDDVDSVELASAGEAPPGSRGLELAAIGGLILRVASKEALAKAVEVVRRWVARDGGRTAKLVVGGSTIELSGLNAAQQQQLIDEWLALVRPPGASGPDG